MDRDENCVRFEKTPAFFEDFNLPIIINAISEKWGEDVSAFYSYLSGTPKACNYRRAVLKDLQQETLFDACILFMKAIEKYQEICENKEKINDGRQGLIWHIREVQCYCECIEQLQNSLSETELCSEGMKEFQTLLNEYVKSEHFQNLKESATAIFKKLDQFRVRIEYHDNRVYISEATKAEGYQKFLQECFPETKESSFSNPFSATVDLLEFEEEVLSKYMKKNKAFLKEAEAFYEKSKDYVNETILRFHREVVFYLSFISFEKYMANYNYVFCDPLVAEKTEFKAKGLYDLGLAWVNIYEKKDVVANDVLYDEKDQFFVLTGLNQGGKTTYARSLGQLVFFSKMGLDVPAKSASIPFFDEIMKRMMGKWDKLGGRTKDGRAGTNPKILLANEVEILKLYVDTLFELKELFEKNEGRVFSEGLISLAERLEEELHRL